ncbi:hypothetical protein POUND7_001010 [Theobroma cacao]
MIALGGRDKSYLLRQQRICTYLKITGSPLKLLLEIMEGSDLLKQSALLRYEVHYAHIKPLLSAKQSLWFTAAWFASELLWIGSRFEHQVGAIAAGRKFLPFLAVRMILGIFFGSGEVQVYRQSGFHLKLNRGLMLKSYLTLLSKEYSELYAVKTFAEKCCDIGWLANELLSSLVQHAENHASVAEMV